MDSNILTERRVRAALFILVLAPLPGCRKKLPALGPSGKPLLYPVVVAGKYGYIDSLGAERVPPRYEQALDFSEGLAPVQVAGLWGYLGEDGREAISPRFESAFPFSGGVARVRQGRYWGILDKAGNWAVPPRFEVLEEPGQPYTAARAGGRWGFIDASGRWVLSTEFDRVWSFSEGLARVSSGGGYGFIDPAGNMVLTPAWSAAGEFHGGLAFARAFDGATGCIDRTGRFAAPACGTSAKGLAARPFSEGLAAVRGPAGWSYIDKSGTTVLPGPFEDAGDFRGGVARVISAGKTGYIDARGVYVWAPQQ